MGIVKCITLVVIAVAIVVVVAFLEDIRFSNYQKPAIAAVTTTNYTAADVPTKPNKTILALFTYGKVNSKLLEMYQL
jgi:hypothetical protein